MYKNGRMIGAKIQGTGAVSFSRGQAQEAGESYTKSNLVVMQWTWHNSAVAAAHV